LGETLHAVATGRLAEQPPLVWRDGAAVTVVLAAENYPGTPRRGDVIDGAEQPGVLHAGTATGPDGRLVSAGGRVLSVVGTGPALAAARAEARRTRDGIELGGGHFRSDIGRAAEEGRISVPDGPPGPTHWESHRIGAARCRVIERSHPGRTLWTASVKPGCPVPSPSRIPVSLTFDIASTTPYSTRRSDV